VLHLIVRKPDTVYTIAIYIVFVKPKLNDNQLSISIFYKLLINPFLKPKGPPKKISDGR